MMNLMLACVLLLQDKSAEDTLKAIEESIGKAKTVGLKFKVEVTPKGEGEDKKSDAEGSVLVKEGNKVLIAMKGRQAGKEMEVLVVSDGSKLRIAFRDQGEPKDTPQNFKDWVSVSIARVGGAGTFGMVGLLGGGDKRPPPDLRELLQLSEVAHGENDGNARTLTYRVTYADANQTFDVRLWYEPKSLKLLKRTLAVKSRASQTDVVETYDDYVLGADIPDEKFKLGEGDRTRESRIAATRAALAQLSIALALYEIDNGIYPSTDQGLEALMKKPETDPPAKNWKGPYLAGKALPKDPWGRPYSYKFPGDKNTTGFDLFSAGPDGKAGTDDDVSK